MKTMVENDLTTPKNTHQSERIFETIRRNIAVISICALTIVIILLIVTITLLLTRNQPPITLTIVSRDGSESNSTQLKVSQELEHNDSDVFVSRDQWNARSPVHLPGLLPLPVPYVIIHHTATENCTTRTRCISQVRAIQTFHIESRNWYDIAYNFLIGGDGAVYEGRGWKFEGSHTYGYNSKSIGIAFMGNFVRVKPVEKQFVACRELIEKGVQLGFIKEDYKILAARQVHATESPGATLFEEMKSWKHWVEEV